MHDGLLRAFKAFETCSYQVFTALGQHLYFDIVRNTAGANQSLNEVELGRTGARETDFDFLDPDSDQFIEKAVFLYRIHRVNDRLIAVAQIGRKPAGRGGDGS